MSLSNFQGKLKREQMKYAFGSASNSLGDPRETKFSCGSGNNSAVECSNKKTNSFCSPMVYSPKIGAYTYGSVTCIATTYYTNGRASCKCKAA